jgi:hypothetical protein
MLNFFSILKLISELPLAKPNILFKKENSDSINSDYNRANLDEQMFLE